MPRFPTAIAPVLVMLPLAACAGVLDLDGYRSANEGSGGASNSVTATSTSAGGSGANDATIASSSASAGGGGGSPVCFEEAAGCACPTRAPGCTPLPSGWAENVWFYQGPGADAPTCLGNMAVGALDPSQVNCGTCGCSAPTSTCAANVTLHSNNLCTMAIDTVALPAIGSCMMAGELATSSVSMAFTAQSGTCQPMGGPTIPPSTYAMACADLAGACPAGCFAMPSQDEYDKAICVQHGGDMGCPAGYPIRHVITAPSDACTPCACGSASGTDCNVRVYTNAADCTGLFGTLYQQTDCAVGLPQSVGLNLANAGSCAPTGGDAIPSPPATHTVCCAALP